MMIGWIVGFVDGEGCFSINFIRQPERKIHGRVRRGYKTGYQVAHEFAVVQGEKSLRCLQEMHDFFVKRLGTMRGIRRTETTSIMRIAKRVHSYPVLAQTEPE